MYIKLQLIHLEKKNAIYKTLIEKNIKLIHPIYMFNVTNKQWQL
jgi:hypothetical protein